MRRIALVDFDGVVLKNDTAKQFIYQRVDRFMRRRFPSLPSKLVQDLNCELYQGHGHTFLGLKHMGLEVALSDFNKELYSDLTSNLKLDVEEKDAWDRFYRSMKKQGIPIFMFSNATKEWCNHFVDFNEYHVKYLQDEWLLYHHHNMHESMLKPEKTIYDIIRQEFPNTQFLYWEDKMINFQHVMNDPYWIKVWVNNKASKPQTLKQGLFVTPSLDIMPWA